MCQFIETIRIDHGKACNLLYHNKRLNATRSHFWAGCGTIHLEDHLSLSPEMDGMKCRVLYDGSGIKDITCSDYVMRPVYSLRLVCSDEIEYVYKSVDREKLNKLYACRNGQDDILIVKRGLLTDTSIANIALSDGTGWYTPRSPLLKGTRRAALLDKGVLAEREIRVEELSSFSFVRLFNAMIEWGALELPVHSIYNPL